MALTGNNRPLAIEVEPLTIIIQAVFTGMIVLLAATLPRNVVFAANFRYFSAVPWSAPLLGAMLWVFWQYVGGWGPPESSSAQRRANLRANPLAGRVWAWALAAGALGIGTLVAGLRLANRLVELPEQQPPDLSAIPAVTILLLVFISSLFAGVVEEAAFRGYMQGPIEREYGPIVAILITGVMFAVAHLDFTPVLLPYYVAVAAIYGMVTHLTNSILPAVVLHTGGNIYSNTDLWLRGRAEWQASSDTNTLIWNTGTDPAFWMSAGTFVALAAITIWAYSRLAGTMHQQTGRH